MIHLPCSCAGQQAHHYLLHWSQHTASWLGTQWYSRHLGYELKPLTSLRCNLTRCGIRICVCQRPMLLHCLGAVDEGQLLLKLKEHVKVWYKTQCKISSKQYLIHLQDTPAEGMQEEIKIRVVTLERGISHFEALLTDHLAPTPTETILIFMPRALNSFLSAHA